MEGVSFSDCGDCGASQRCNASNICECAPLQCEDVTPSAMCGSLSDGCGRTIECGNCTNTSAPWLPWGVGAASWLAAYNCTASRQCECVPLSPLEACPAMSFGLVGDGSGSGSGSFSGSGSGSGLFGGGGIFALTGAGSGCGPVSDGCGGECSIVHAANVYCPLTRWP